jgi:hypothetical protein
MDTYQGDIPLGKIEEENKERDFFEDVGTSWDIASLSFGDGVDVASRNKTFENYTDYKDNEQSYKAYSDMSAWYRSASSEKLQRQFIDKAIEEKKFMLDEEGNVVAGENASPISMYLYDNDAVKGGLLARKNGWNKQVSEQAYSDETARQSKELAAKAEGSSIGAKITGTLAGYAFRQETAIEVAASPAKIVGSSILGGMGKAFVTEFAIGAFGETLREKAIQEHMAKAGLDYTLWDSAKNILIGAGLAGSLRGIGSGVVDAKILKQVDSAGLEATDKEILNRYFRREQYKLTTNSRANIELLHKVEDDINRGKEVDVSEFTDIDINTKTDELIPENSMPDEISKINRELGIQKDLDNINKQVDEIKPLQEAEDDIYDGMATPKEADELFAEMSDVDPEIKIEFEAIKQEREAIKKGLSPRAEAAREAKEPSVGGSEDEAKQAVKDLFKKPLDPDARYKSMTKEDIAEVERIAREDIIESKPPSMTDDEWVEANKMFAKGIDNLVAGTVAGIETDEQGNITFDAEKFVLGLGGYTAVKAILTNPKVQSELKGWAERAINELETNPKFDMVTGTQRIVPNEAPMPKEAPQFYSQLETALAQTSQKTWNKEQLKGFLAKQGVKAEEMKWSGLDDYLEGKTKVSTDELLSNMNQPKLEKTVLGEYELEKLTKITQNKYFDYVKSLAICF